MPVVPSNPPEKAPAAPMAPRVSAPPLGNRSDTTPSIVGQKNVLPTPYTVAARNTARPAVELPSQNKPTMASVAQENRRPSGEILWTMGPAKNRSTNMMLEG